MIRFGTDGWRAVISDEFTFENVRKVAQAIADYYNQFPQETVSKTIALGYDTRFLSDKYAKCIGEILAANGFEVLFAETIVPTPSVSIQIVKKKLLAGVMVTASHNPPEYNGIKIKASFGGPVETDVTYQIEKLIGKNPIQQIPFEEAVAAKKIALTDFYKEHVKTITSYINFKTFKNKKFRVLVDAMHGASGRLIEKLLADSSVKVTTIRSEVNPSFGGFGPEPIPKHLSEMNFRMKEGAFDIGVVNDGDADRIAAMRPDGRYISPSEIIALLALHLVEERKWTGGVVKTVSCSVLIDRVARKLGLKVYETAIGFKHICKLMREQDILIGGEESGGIGVKNYIPERDGILLALLLLEMMADRNSGITQIMDQMEKDFGRFHYLREDIHFEGGAEKKNEILAFLKDNLPTDLMGRKIVSVKSFDGMKFICEDDSWLLIRFSGTESLLRVYAESDSLKFVKELIQYGRKLAQS